MDPIQPLTIQPADISVTAPIGQALDRVKRVLFRPFDLGKWFVIGFAAWLAYLGEQGFSGGGHFGGPPGGGSGNGSFRRGLEDAWDYMMSNLSWIVPLVVVVVVVVLILWV